MEQVDVQLLFQLANRMADTRLGDKKPFGRAGQILLFGGPKKRPVKLQIGHAPINSFYTSYNKY